MSAEALKEIISLGLAERKFAGTEAAVPHFMRAAELFPLSALPFFMLGNATSELGNLDSAVAYYERACALSPADHVIHYNLGLNHYWRGDVTRALVALEAARRLDPSYVPAQITYLMALHNDERSSPELVAREIAIWGKGVASRFPPMPCTAGLNSGRRRIGFVSGDFRVHSVAHFFLPLLQSRDRDRFEYLLYSTSHHQDEVTDAMKAGCDGWRECWQLSTSEMRSMIRADRIDILVDLSGLTEYNRLDVFSTRAAPVQITYVGCPSSTGIGSMDFRITDSITDPAPIAESFHSERLLRLPRTQWCFRPFGRVSHSNSSGCGARSITFASLNNLIKISDTILGCWAQILREVPNSILRLTRVRSPGRAQELLRFLERQGVARDRVDCVAYLPTAPHGSQCLGVDIALDPFPYNGVTTTCEALSCGVPVVSLCGEGGVSRSGKSLLEALDLPELVASTPDEYVRIAVDLASEPGRLESMRNGLADRFERSILRDEAAFARSFEALLDAAVARAGST